MRRSIFSLQAALALLAFFGSLPERAIAGQDDLRIETRVFAGEEDVLVGENLTLFSAGVIYDYRLAAEEQVVETAVFDRDRGRFVLLDPASQTRTEVTTATVLDYCRALEQLAATERDPLLRFAARPEFDVRYDKASSELVLAHRMLTYRAVTQPAADAVRMAAYRQYADWYAQLGAIFRPGSLPPFPRLALNRELAALGHWAEKIELNYEHEQGLASQPVRLRSEHKIFARLLDVDRRRIERTHAQMTEFRPVDWQQYRRTQIDRAQASASD